MKIIIFGTGCPKCKAVEQLTKDALAELNFTADIEHSADFKEMAKYGVAFTPGLVINGNLKSSGKVPTLDQLKAWILEET